MIASEITALLDPLERFEAVRRRAFRLGDRLADLSYANPYAGVQEQARAILADALATERPLSLQYSPFGGQTMARRAVADSLRASHGLAASFRDVVLTPGAMSALQLALRASGSPGGDVIVPTPCWLDFPLYAHHCGHVPVTVALPPPGFDLDVDAIAAAVTSRTCALLLADPANPTGRNYSRRSLEELARALHEREEALGCEITVISDETHRDFVDREDYTSISAFFERTLLVHSFGKYHFMQGQRLGYVATSPLHPAREEVRTELVRWTRVSGIATPTALMQQALPALLAVRYPHEAVSYWRERVCEELTASGYEVVPPDGTLFVYVRTPAGVDDWEFVDRLVSRGVLVLPAAVFHHDGYVRLSLTGSERMLEQALPVLKGMAS